MTKLPKKIDTAQRDLLREILGGVKLEDVVFLDKLRGEERQNFLKYCYGVVNNPYFQQLGEYLSLIQLQKSVEVIENEKTNLIKATLNGISLWGEVLSKYAKEWEVVTKPLEKFEPHQAFTPVTLEKNN